MTHAGLVAFFGLFVIAPLALGAAFLFVVLAYLLGFGERVTVHVTGVDAYDRSEGVGYYLADGVRQQVPVSLADAGDTFTARFLVIPAWRDAPVTDFALILALLAAGVGLVALGLTVRYLIRRVRMR